MSSERLGNVMVVIISTITNAGGVGAGTIIIPVYMFFYGFVSSDAIPLSRVTIFAGSFINYLLNWNQRDPHAKNRLMINYPLASVMMPLLLAGTQIGVIFSRFLPAAAVTLILVFYLTSSAQKMLERAKKDTAIENENLRKLKEEEENKKNGKTEWTRVPQGPTSPEIFAKGNSNSKDRDNRTSEVPTTIGTKEGKNSANNSTSSMSSGGESPKVGFSEEEKDLIKQDSEFGELGDEEEEIGLIRSRQSKGTSKMDIVEIIPEKLEDRQSTCYLMAKQSLNWLIMLVALFAVGLSALARGGEGTGSIIGIDHCGMASWGIFLITQILSAAMAFGSYLINRGEFIEEDRSIKDKKEVEHRMETRRKLMYASYKTGILAGLLGIGGGMVIGLYMISLGMDVHVTTALSTFVVLFSSAATTFQFVVAGAIHMRHAQRFMFLSLIGSLLGNLVLKAILKKYKRPSILVWILFSVLCIAMAVLPIEMALNIMQKNKSAMAFGPFC